MSGVPTIDASDDVEAGDVPLSRAVASGRLTDRWVTLTASVAVGIAFLVSAKLGHLVAIAPGTITPIWIPSGFALVGVLLFGARVWPGIWVAAFMAGAPTIAMTDSLPDIVRTFLVGAGIATGSTLEPIIGASLYARAVGRPNIDPMSSVRALALFLGLAGCVSASVSATVGVTSLAVGGLLPWSTYLNAWLTWWVGNAGGVVLVAPLLLVWRSWPQWLRSQRAWIKPVGWLAVLTAFAELLTGNWLGREVAAPLALATVPILVALSYRYGSHAATLGGALVATVALANTAQGEGPFVGESLNKSLLLLQLCIAMIVTTGLTMSAAVNERRREEQLSHRLNAALAHAGRVSLTGEMAAGMAHEFHQPLSVIANYANSCLIRLRSGEPLGEEAREPLQNIVNETMRAARVIRGIRGFLKKTEQSSVLTDINTLIADSVELAMVAGHDDHLTVDLKLDSRNPQAWVDTTQVTQVVVNLLLNAIDAMKEDPETPGRVEIRTRARMDSVEVRIADSGPGIAEEDREKCFEHFYTTKEEGLGMGLAICRRLVERQGGRMWIEHSALRGAEFCFTLPEKPLFADFEVPPGTDRAV
jgi:signal transduction histidine kinase